MSMQEQDNWIGFATQLALQIRELGTSAFQKRSISLGHASVDHRLGLGNNRRISSGSRCTLSVQEASVRT